MKSDRIQPTTNEAPHPISAIRSMGRKTHLRHPIIYLDGEVVNPRGEAVCDQGAMERIPSVKASSRLEEVLWRTFGDIHGQLLGVCDYYTSELSRRWDRREDSRAVVSRQSKG
ncbi:hypothetical protein M405DRAFT_809896, partial [Rhizopogon salebrosus TDB-379]